MVKIIFFFFKKKKLMLVQKKKYRNMAKFFQYGNVVLNLVTTNMIYFYFLQTVTYIQTNFRKNFLLFSFEWKAKSGHFQWIISKIAFDCCISSWYKSGMNN